MNHAADQQKVSIHEKFRINAFRKDVLIYTSGSALIILFSLIQSFIIPKYLSVQDYGYWQFFLLYGGYVGILHFGFLDGVLVRWAGKQLDEIGSELNTAFKFLVIEQVVVLVPLAVIISFVVPLPTQWIILIVIVYSLILLVSTLFTIVMQATRHFKLLTVLNVARGLLFLLLVILLFFLGHFSYQIIILVHLVVYALILGFFIFYFRRYVFSNFSLAGCFSYAKTQISMGFFILVGNLMSILILSVDRLTISSSLPIEQFAFYAFALSIVNICYAFIRAISDVLFPYLSLAKEELHAESYLKGKSAIFFLWAAFLCLYFPMAWIIQVYLPKYVESLPLIQTLLALTAFGSIIQILHINYYKIYAKQKLYLLITSLALVLIVGFIYLAIYISGVLQSIAIAMAAGFCAWYIANHFALKSVTGEKNTEIIKDLLIIVIYFAAFQVASLVTSQLIFQFLIYLIFFFVLSLGAFRSEIKSLLALIPKVKN